ncbi:MAG: hypothetical protein ACLUKN_16500 [Bacilli bacterium]
MREQGFMVLKLWVVFGLQHRQVVFDIVYIVAFSLSAGFILHLMVVNQVGFNPIIGLHPFSLRRCKNQ